MQHSGICQCVALPVIKWAGGKRQLLPIINKKIPKSYKNYYEPFFGGGALFFELMNSCSNLFAEFDQHRKIVINDCNHQLINVYTQIKTSLSDVISFLNKFQKEYNNLVSDVEKTDYYLSKRNEFNYFIANNVFTAESASIFIFLNKAGYNGLYRVNKRGLFNVPSAHRKSLKLFDIENIYNVSHLLQKCIIKQEDFETACDDACEGDFIFFDSPYYDTFSTYHAGGFSENDHTRLASLFKKLANNGVYCMATNNDCDFIKHLYSDFEIETVLVNRMINCNAKKRTGREVVITNFK